MVMKLDADDDLSIGSSNFSDDELSDDEDFVPEGLKSFLAEADAKLKALSSDVFSSEKAPNGSLLTHDVSHDDDEGDVGHPCFDGLEESIAWGERKELKETKKKLSSLLITPYKEEEDRLPVETPPTSELPFDTDLGSAVRPNPANLYQTTEEAELQAMDDKPGVCPDHGDCCSCNISPTWNNTTKKPFNLEEHLCLEEATSGDVEVTVTTPDAKTTSTHLPNGAQPSDEDDLLKQNNIKDLCLEETTSGDVEVTVTTPDVKMTNVSDEAQSLDDYVQQQQMETKKVVEEEVVEIEDKIRAEPPAQPVKSLQDILPSPEKDTIVIEPPALLDSSLELEGKEHTRLTDNSVSIDQLDNIIFQSSPEEIDDEQFLPEPDVNMEVVETSLDGDELFFPNNATITKKRDANLMQLKKRTRSSYLKNSQKPVTVENKKRLSIEPKILPKSERRERKEEQTSSTKETRGSFPNSRRETRSLSKSRRGSRSLSKSRRESSLPKAPPEIKRHPNGSGGSEKSMSMVPTTEKSKASALSSEEERKRSKAPKLHTQALRGERKYSVSGKADIKVDFIKTLNSSKADDPPTSDWVNKKPIIPKSPRLSTSERALMKENTRVKSKNETKTEKRFPFKAKPIGPAVLSAPKQRQSTNAGSTAPPKLPKKCVTPKPFVFRTEERSSSHRISSLKKTPQSPAAPKPFRARPMPDLSYKPPVPASNHSENQIVDVKEKKKIITPKPFVFHTKERSRSIHRIASPKKAPQSPAPPKQFRARPMPDLSYKPPVSSIQNQNTVVKEKKRVIVPKPFVLRTSERGTKERISSPKKAQKSPPMKQFRARPMPDLSFKPPQIKKSSGDNNEHQKKAIRTPKPFRLRTRERSSERSISGSSVKQARCSQETKSPPRKFRARPMPTFTAKPPLLKNQSSSCGKAELTNIEPFKLASSDKSTKMYNLRARSKVKEADRNKEPIPFKAKPMPDFISSKSGDFGIPKVEKRPPTIVKPFQLRTEKRSADEKAATSSSESNKSPPKTFRARPMPDLTYRPPSPSRQSSVKRELITPEPFKLSVSERDRVRRASIDTNTSLERKPINFRDLPKPPSPSTRRNMGVTKSSSFDGEGRLRRRLAVNSASEKEDSIEGASTRTSSPSTKPFRARKMPNFSVKPTVKGAKFAQIQKDKESRERKMQTAQELVEKVELINKVI